MLIGIGCSLVQGYLKDEYCAECFPAILPSQECSTSLISPPIEEAVELGRRERCRFHKTPITIKSVPEMTTVGAVKVAFPLPLVPGRAPVPWRGESPSAFGELSWPSSSSGSSFETTGFASGLESSDAIVVVVLDVVISGKSVCSSVGSVIGSSSDVVMVGPVSCSVEDVRMLPKTVVSLSVSGRTSFSMITSFSPVLVGWVECVGTAVMEGADECEGGAENEEMVDTEGVAEIEGCDVDAA